MRIAQIAPLYESVPPRLYGGTERVVSHLTEELVRRGHQVTLFATGDSATRAQLVASTTRALRLDPSVVDPVAHHLVQLRHVLERADEFDVIHNHMDYLGLPLAPMTRTPVVTTFHGRLDLPELPRVLGAYDEVLAVSISDAQRRPLPAVRWLRTIHHGIPARPVPRRDGAGDYLAFLGRISPEKRVDVAIRVAQAAGVPLKIAAKVDPVDRAYFRSEIRPLLKGRLVEYVGEVNDIDKGPFLAQARALLFPIDWPEPFGLVMIEALAVGTPVIARRRGSVPEVIDHGETGFICDDESAMVDAVRRIGELDRRHCQKVFNARFSSARMAADYVRVYDGLVARVERGAA